MSDTKVQPAVYYLIDELYAKMKEYRNSLINDEIFEVRKKILNQIRQLEKEIELIKNTRP